MISLGETSVLVENESHHCDRIQKGSSYISMRMQVFFPLARFEEPPKARKQPYASYDLGIRFPYRCLAGNLGTVRWISNLSQRILVFHYSLHLTLVFFVRAAVQSRSSPLGRYKTKRNTVRNRVLERTFPALSARLRAFDIRLLLRFATVDWLYDARVTFSPTSRFKIVVCANECCVSTVFAFIADAEAEKLEIRSGTRLCRKSTGTCAERMRILDGCCGNPRYSLDQCAPVGNLLVSEEYY